MLHDTCDFGKKYRTFLESKGASLEIKIILPRHSVLVFWHLEEHDARKAQDDGWKNSSFDSRILFMEKVGGTLRFRRKSV